MGANQPALPLLNLSMIARMYNQPPVEEFLIAEALLAIKHRPDRVTNRMGDNRRLPPFMRPAIS